MDALLFSDGCVAFFGWMRCFFWMDALLFFRMDVLLFSPDGCVCIEVKYLQDGLQTHAMTRRDDALLFFGWMRWYRGKIFAR
jgi:hypothetical protein